MKKYFFPILILFSAISISFSAAYFSVFGISKVFYGVYIQALIMASTLEFSKLVIAASLHRYWKSIGFLKLYLIPALVILMLITSAGIYGFLLSGYQDTKLKDLAITKQIQVREKKRQRYEEQLNTLLLEKENNNKAILELSSGLSNNIIQWKDKETGQILTSTSSSTRRVLTEQLNDLKTERTLLGHKIDVFSDSITNLDLQIIDIESSSDISSELGPLKYLSSLTGKSMDVVVNWFLLLLIFVFDPLAITLVILSSHTFSQVKQIKEIPLPAQKEEILESNNPIEIIDIIKSDPEVIEIEQVEPKKRRLDSNLPESVADILNSLSLDTSLTPTQIRNMAHQEVTDWERKHPKKHK